MNENISNSSIYPKTGIKKSLHYMGLQAGFKSALDSVPNNLYIIDNQRKIIYTYFSPNRKDIATLMSLK